MNQLRAFFRRHGEPQVELWIRFVGQSQSAMSPAHDGPRAMIEYFPMQQVGDAAYQEFMMEGARRIFAQNGGRRHWGKEGRGGVELYPAETVAAFQALRRHMDPVGRLRNRFTREIGLDP